MGRKGAAVRGSVPDSLVVPPERGIVGNLMLLLDCFPLGLDELVLSFCWEPVVVTSDPTPDRLLWLPPNFTDGMRGRSLEGEPATVPRICVISTSRSGNKPFSLYCRL